MTEAHARESYFPYHRLHHIHCALVHHRAVSTVKLAGELGVHERTIRRDIQHMRDEFGLVIDYEPVTRTWVCRDPGDTLPLFQVTANETIALALANRTFAAWHGTGLGQALESILSKLGKAVSGAMTLPVSDIAPLYQADISASREHRFTPKLIHAIQSRKVIRISYHKLHAASPEPDTREIWPLRLACQDCTWSLVAWDPARADLRTFVLLRIESLETANTGTFDPPDGLDIDQRLKHAFGLWSGDETLDIAIRFDAYAAPYLREKAWHPTQSLEDLPDGSLIARFRLNHLMDIQRWILSWGEHAEALEPPALRNNLRTIAAKLTHTYAPKSLEQ